MLGSHRIVAQVDTPRHTLPAYRGRLLGVFDEASGEPIEGVQVIDLATGVSALTTQTGTVSLVFLPDSGSFVRVRKLGYEVKTFLVAISPADTAPLTIALSRVADLPAVVTKANARRYLSPALRGFEERRAQGAGYFIVDSVLRRNEDRLLGDVISSRIPGVAIERRG
ncbi:MAG TPA: hypothetical protein VHV78_01265, partial [Gemmatimonadaceae bacterium]|nr:hypothetical protein [Gemmatimonadaceae bacterium]